MVAINFEMFAVVWDRHDCYAHISDVTDRQFALITALNGLPRTFRQVLILFAFERRSREEIAALFSWPTGCVRMVLFLCGALLSKSCYNISSGMPDHDDLTAKVGGQYTVFGELVALKTKLDTQMTLF